MAEELIIINERLNNILTQLNEINILIATLHSQWQSTSGPSKELLNQEIMLKIKEIEKKYEEIFGLILNSEILQLYFSLNIKLDASAKDDDKVFNVIFSKFRELKRKLNTEYESNSGLLELIYESINKIQKIKDSVDGLKKSMYMSPPSVTESLFVGGGLLQNDTYYKKKYLKYKQKYLNSKN